MRGIVESSVRFRLLVLTAAAVVLAVGIAHVRSMPRDVLPEFVPPSVEVQTEAPGLSAEEVKELITVPMEQDLLSGVAFLQDMRSESVPGLSRILLVFEPGTDLYRARQVVAERMTQAVALPHVSKPPQMLQPLSSTNRVLMFGMTSTRVSPIEMSVLARWTIVPRLLGVPGVANVSIWGQRDRQLQVEVDPRRLRAHHVSLLQVVETAGNALWVSPLTFVEASTPGSGGFIDTPNQRLTVQHVSPIVRPVDLAQVRVEDTTSLRLGNVATLRVDHPPLIGDAVVGGGRGLMLVVEKFPGASTPAVTRGVERALDALRPGLSGIRIEPPVYRPATYLDRATHTVTLGLAAGAVLVALLLAALFLRLRALAVCAVVIPFSFVTAVFVLDLLGATLNAVVLTGLVAAIALVVDDAVIMAGARSTHDVAEARRPALYATLAVAVAALPFVVLNGLAGAFFPDLVLAFLLAVLAALVTGTVLTPAISSLLPSRDTREPWRLRRAYEAGLGRVLDRPWTAAGAAGFVALAGTLAALSLSNELLPTIKETQVLIPWQGPPGTSVAEMDRVTARATRELRALPGVTGAGAHLGRATTGDQPVNVDAAEIWVGVDPARYDATLASIRRVISGYPGLSHDIETFSNERVREVLTGSVSDLVVRVYGDERGALAAAASRVRDTIAGVPGVTGAHVAEPTEQPTLQIKVDLAAAARYGIRPGDVRRAASTLLSGLVVGSLFQAQKVFDVVVRGTPATRRSLTSVRNLLIDTPAGGRVRLGAVAGVRIAPRPAVIRREASSLYLDVDAAVRNRSRDAVAADVRHRLAGLRLPLAVHAEVLAARTQPVRTIAAVGLAAAIGMFLLLQALLRSWRAAIAAFATLPLALAGALVAARLAGATLSFGFYAASLAGVGLSVRHAAYLFDRVRSIDVLQAAGERAAPVAAATLAGALALLPFVVLGDRPGLELVHPLAVAMLGGLAGSALGTLVVAPTLYLALVRRPVRDVEPDQAAEAAAIPDVAA